MRYGKVYFYDRMGNREGRQSHVVKGQFIFFLVVSPPTLLLNLFMSNLYHENALDNFDAPRFRPPDNIRLSKRYQSKYSPLSSPAPIEIPSSNLLFDPIKPLDPLGPSDSPSDSIPRALFRPSSPPLIPPQDPFPNINMTPPPRSLNPLYNMHEGEESMDDINRSLTTKGQFTGLSDDLSRFEMNEGLDKVGMSGIGGASGGDFIEKRWTTEDKGEWRNESLFTEDKGLTKISHVKLDDEYDQVCEQCRLEEQYMESMRRKAEEEDRMHKAAKERANLYESEMERKEALIKKEEEDRKRSLQALVDNVNHELIEENRRRPKSPPLEYNVFRHEDPTERDRSLNEKKEAYGKELEDQIDGGRRQRLEMRQLNDNIDVKSNQRAAREYADQRSFDEKQRQHDMETLKKSLEFQMEMHNRRPKSGTEYIWWAERPDEHGWRETRMRVKGKERQLEKNYSLQKNIHNLEEFKKRLELQDVGAKEAEKIRYARLRDELHANSKLLWNNDEYLSKRKTRETIKAGIDPRVEAAWREAHERNDKRYRILQEAEGKTVVVGHGCKRCVRCARPLHRYTSTTTTGAKLEWHPL